MLKKCIFVAISFVYAIQRYVIGRDFSKFLPIFFYSSPFFGFFEAFHNLMRAVIPDIMRIIASIVGLIPSMVVTPEAVMAGVASRR
jgi:hypothetical protein